MVLPAMTTQGSIAIPEPTEAWDIVLPLLHEIRHALQRLIDRGESTQIDLQSLPFHTGEEANLLAALGRGEVEVSLDALGVSRIWETAYAGVWVVDHYDPEGRRIALSLEVTRVPELLLSHPADLRGALACLDQTLTADWAPHGWHPANELRRQHG